MRNMKRERHLARQAELMQRLPFIGEAPDGDLDFWAVAATADDLADSLRGRQFGVLFAKATAAGLATGVLAEVVRAMPSVLGPVEHGFLTAVAHSLAVGPNIAAAAVRLEVEKWGDMSEGGSGASREPN